MYVVKYISKISILGVPILIYTTSLSVQMSLFLKLCACVNLSRIETRVESKDIIKDAMDKAFDQSC